jgi:3-dehydroquinate dehydratase/shikimate dehydrogenase
MLDLYRFRSIGAKTKVYGVIGWPVEHSLSPLVHNAGFEAVGHDGVYLPLPIAADEKEPAGEGTYLSFKATLEALLEYEGLDLSGLSVTMPFKEHLVRWVREAKGSGFTTDFDQRVWEIGAANTVHVNGPIIEVGNTDAMAIEALLDGAMGRLSGKSVAIIGAGGVAWAAVWACAARGASVTVYNRTRERAEKMVGELVEARKDGMWGSVVVAEMSELEQCAADAVINCTSVGMAGGSDAKGMAAPVKKMGRLPEHAVFMETVYRPVETPLVRAARERGLRVIDGVEMFVEQAARQFAMWTGKSAPKGLFARVCREALGEKAGGA